jgi:hypothetical protein
MKRVRYSRIKKQAEIIDLVITRYMKIRGRKNFPRKTVRDIVPIIVPHSKFLGHGAYKHVHLIKLKGAKLVLKTSSRKSTKSDWTAYQRLPATIRNRYFAKIYWSTTYCQLQKFGKATKISKTKLQNLKAVGKKYGLTDIRPANVRKFAQQLKIVDANVLR